MLLHLATYSDRHPSGVTGCQPHESTILPEIVIIGFWKFVENSFDGVQSSIGRPAKIKLKTVNGLSNYRHLMYPTAAGQRKKSDALVV
jgi:hypothetical protein